MREHQRRIAIDEHYRTDRVEPVDAEPSRSGQIVVADYQVLLRAWCVSDPLPRMRTDCTAHGDVADEYQVVIDTDRRLPVVVEARVHLRGIGKRPVRVADDVVVAEMQVGPDPGRPGVVDLAERQVPHRFQHGPEHPPTVAGVTAPGTGSGFEFRLVVVFERVRVHPRHFPALPARSDPGNAAHDACGTSRRTGPPRPVRRRGAPSWQAPWRSGSR